MQRDDNFDKEEEYARRLRQQQAAARTEYDGPEDNMSLRQRLAAKRIKNAAKQKLEEKVTAPARMATGQLLKFSWLNLIDSFGLTLIYINMHVFLRWVFPDMFCKLGDEWLPKQASVLGANEAMKNTGQAIGIAEVMGLLLLDILAIIVVGGALALIVMITGWISHPLDAIMNLGWNAVNGLVNLFKGLL